MADIKVKRVNRNFTIKVHLYYNADSYNRDDDSTPRFYLKPVELLYVEKMGYTPQGSRTNGYLKYGNRFWKNKHEPKLTDAEVESIYAEVKNSYPYGYVDGDLASTNKYKFDVKKNEAFQSFYQKYWNANSSKVVQNNIHNSDGTVKYPHPYIEFTTNDPISYKYTSGTIPPLPSGVSISAKYGSAATEYYTRPTALTCHDATLQVTFNATNRNHYLVDNVTRQPVTMSSSGRYRFDLVSGDGAVPYTLWPTGAGGTAGQNGGMYSGYPFRFSTGKDGVNAGFSDYVAGVSYVTSPEVGSFYTKVMLKTASTGAGDDAHIYMSTGHSSGYALSGNAGSSVTGINVSGFGYDEGPVLTLRRESTYRFYQSDASNSGYEMQISTDPSGQNSNVYTSGVQSSSSLLKFVVPVGAPSRLYYTDKNYAYAGGPIDIIDSPAAPKTGTIPGESIILDNNLSTESGLFYYCQGEE